MHVCPQYSDDLFWYYPARIPYIVTYFVAMLEFPYILHIFSSDALLYARAFMAVTYPLCTFMLIERYFFYTRFSNKYIILIVLSLSIFLIPLFYYALLGGNTMIHYESQVMTVAIIISLIEIIVGMKLIRKLYKREKAEAEKEYSSSKDFPTDMAKKLIRCLPALTIICVIFPSLFHSAWAKFVRDILLAIFDVWITATTLVSHRPIKPIMNEEQDDDNSVTNESEDLHSPFSELLDKIVNIVITEQLYLNPSAKLDELVSAVGSNRRYVSKAISDSKWQSFYRLMNSLRIARAIELKKIQPTIKQEELAIRSGFASRFTLNRWMKTWEKGELNEIDENILEKINN